MTVASTATKTIVLGPGGGPFAYNFMIPTTSDVSIIYTNTSGVETILTTSQYTITGVGTGSGTVTLTGSPLIAGETLTILRDITYTQLVSLINQGASYPAVVESALDRLTMEVQQVGEVTGRTIVGPSSDSSAMTALPGAAARAGNALIFDVSGNPTVGAIPTGYPTSAPMAPVTGAASLSAGRTALGLGALAVEGLGKGLVDDGASNARVQFVTEAKSISYLIASTDHYEQYIVTGPVTFTLPLTTGLWNGFGFWVDVYTGTLILTPNAADAIEGGATGAGTYVPAGSKAFVVTNAAGSWYIRQLKTNISTTQPGGYLTTTSGYTAYPGDVAAATTLYYTPDMHGVLPIYTGSVWIDIPFSELSCPLYATQQALNTAHDVFGIMSTAGNPTLVIGPAWRNPGSGLTGAPSNFTNATPIVVTAASHNLQNGDIVQVAAVQGNTAANGIWTVANRAASTFELAGSVGNGAYTSGTGVFAARGVGSSTTQLTRQGGLYVNAVQMTAYNSTTSYVAPAKQGTYLGSILIDDTAGQLTCIRSWGQSRRWAVWNAYNRKPITMPIGDPTATWAYSTATWRVSNNNTANSAMMFCGLAEETASVDFGQYRTASGTPYLGIGVASPSVPDGTFWSLSSGVSGTQFARSIISPIIGAVPIYCLEKGGVSTTWSGSLAAMQMTASYRG